MSAPNTQRKESPGQVSDFPGIWTLPEVAERLRVPVSFVRLLIARGQLQFQRLGKRHVVKADDVRAYVERNWRREGQAAR
jgi:excisionase family DNA binding protein